MSTAFYASFLPSRASNRASGYVDPAEGLTFPGAILAQSQSSRFSGTVENQSSRSFNSTANSSPLLAVPPAVAANPLNLEPDDPELRVFAAATTPEAQPNTLAAPTGTPSPGAQSSATPNASGTPSAGGTPQSGGTPGARSTASVTSTPGSSGTVNRAASGSATPPCEPGSDIFCVYTVQPGDTLGGIAERFGIKGNTDVTAAELLANSNKPDLVDEDDLLQIGQKLRIPTGGAPVPPSSPPAPRVGTPAPGSAPAPAPAAPARSGGVIHTVLSSETLLDIGDKYGVEAADIMSANRSLSDPNKLSIGQELLIPSPKRFAPAAVAAPPPSGGPSSGAPSGPSSVNTGGASQSGFKWPVAGPVSSYFGPNHPLGIDIDLYANSNAPIGSAAAGTVKFAGGNSCCSYGLYVVVDHGNGFQTLYAHLSRVSVSTGQKVTQGQVVGNGGRTGYATGNHLHFEVHLNGSVVNPVRYLP
ncbi:MAG TPA: peptidoglycan DD-metalloendopeptidase family protein [Dehalococcoidia bacterium]|nr:peptidoglycan DD-metalloendopeptidase family protein [Dehalococcoidia bacterium]